MNELFLTSPSAAPLIFREGLLVGLGVLFGLIWGRRTGWSCGGLITPGVLALHAAVPHRIGLVLLLGVILAAPLGLLTRSLGLYGRERVGTAMLLALAVRIALSPFVSSPFGIGWVVPGLVAADVERQGAVMTLCGTLSCTIAALLAATLLRGGAG